MARLLTLNHQRYEEEQTKDRSARPKTKARGKKQDVRSVGGKQAKGKKAGKEQLDLL
jgi:hypothetical protein